jgi:C4-dicarboxylate transporter DctQ subunit
MPAKIMRALNRAEEIILAFMLLQVGCSIFLQVVMRFVFNSAISWLDELIHIEVIALAFFGAALGVKHGAHISVDVVKDTVGAVWRRRLEAFGHLVLAAYSGLVIYCGWSLIALMAARSHATPTLQIPKHYLYIMVAIGMGVIGVRSAAMGVAGVIGRRSAGLEKGAP